MKNEVISLNYFLSVTGSLILGIAANLFYLGSKEEWLMLKEQLPQSFFQRLISFLFIGLLGVIVLHIFNFWLNRTVLKDYSKLNIVKLTVVNSLIVLTSCVSGTIMFFY
jgi:hypothetical protein